MWDEKAVDSYEQWFATRAGGFALACELRLLDHCISSWPRRRHSLLEIGCGPGIFLEHFYRSGFETTGIDPSPAMLAAARARLDPKVDLHQGHGDHLPFRDREYDYVALITVLEFAENPEAILGEARRVARKGILVAYLNKLSLYYLSHGLPLGKQKASTLRRARWFTPFGMRRLLHQAVGPYPHFHRSVLLGPTITWRPRFPWQYLNMFIGFPFLGAFNAVRVDMVSDTPLTPLLLKSQAGVRG